MNEEELNQLLKFIEEDLGTKYFTLPKEFFQTTIDSQEVYFFPGFPRRVEMKEFDAARILDGNPQVMNFPENLENPESPKS